MSEFDTIGSAKICEMLGISESRNQLALQEGSTFPAPVAELTAGRIRNRGPRREAGARHGQAPVIRAERGGQ